jgi:hypothetical protein
MKLGTRILVVSLVAATALLAAWLWFARGDAPAKSGGETAAAETTAIVPDEAAAPAVETGEEVAEPWAEELAGGVASQMPDGLLGPGLTDEWIEFERLSGDMLFPSVPMRMEAAIWRAYQMAATNPAVDAAALGYKMLSSTSAFVRATGAIWMLEKSKTLHPAILDQLIGDEEAFVPLTVLGWMLDSGLEQEARGFEARWRAAPAEAQAAAIDALTDAPLNDMAGRAALWLSERSGQTADEKRNLDSQVLSDEQADYGVRWQAALLLRGRMDFAEYQQVIAGHLSPLPPLSMEAPDPDAAEEPAWEPPTAFEAAMGLLNARTAGPAEVMGRRPVLTKDDADLIFAEESALMLENAALWVEAVTDYGAAEARPGFADALARHVADLPVEELPANQALTLRRIQSRLAVLKQMEREGAPEE